MPDQIIAIIAPGDMGGGVGEALIKAGHDVVTTLVGRSDESRARAERVGFRALPDLDAVVQEASLVLSILPPANAIDLARDVAAAVARTGAERTEVGPVYMDCNAISPDTTKQVGDIIIGAGLAYIDCGIIGWAPGKGPQPTRFYVSGPDLVPSDVLAVDGIMVKSAGAEIGQASALKMLYAGLNKGRFSLFATMATAAEAMGLLDAFGEELAFSQKDTWNYMQGGISRLPADSERWWPEMDEIAATMEAAGVTGDFHRGASWILQLMAATPLAAETRETIDGERTLAETVAIFVDQLKK
ncbi:MAG: NAD(P)-dependent oxidoreductase [Rhodospirillaceae bacterium]|jgi:3-hydroxyisobutyrate dehydrogenase-like beta-hydroxyacid dehydrogenase|nr:NAD(P)-dependent oxidoreductase [Rhodospirillaceae bacterium]MBT4044456.1 NAD(P)-dependent oxidoreductase [Rhodospirillaceae bacterium]MBT4689130.1 NAD(P)-dependent oxidoreductase [Rhodospirillaceae bacterium]MBT5080872.1 NAD(P)-dependent oxidoreductase [Rhodospirillaceae bacterium]MBT5525293.1 NAD(P)-dependent oxidoreductase [Rhodospirillaceae bacterium]